MRTARVVISALVFLLISLSASAYDLLGVNSVSPALAGPGQIKFEVSWNWPPWGANMRVEYGLTTSYGKATDWVNRSGYPFSGTTELPVTGLPDGPLHYRVVIQPSGGPPGQNSYSGPDLVVTPASSAVDLCQRNCPQGDASCKSSCTSDPAYFEKALAACQQKCRADDPDCPNNCRNNLAYVSTPPVITPVTSPDRCLTGWSLHHVFARMDYNCHPLGSDFCKDKQSFESRYDTVCTRVKDQWGNLESTVYTETPCTTRRGAATPDRSVGGNWWQTTFGEWECVGSNYGDCRILCPR
jgi:hypothetical protein